MSLFKNIKINTSIISILVLFMLIIATAIGMRMVTSSKVATQFDMIKDLNIDQLNVVSEINNRQSWLRTRIEGLHIDSLNKQTIDNSRYQDISASIDKIEALLNEYKSTDKWPDEKKLAQPILASTTGLIKMMRGQLQAIKSGNTGRFDRLSKKILGPAEQFHDGLKALMNRVNERNTVLIENYTATQKLFDWLYILLVAISVGLFLIAYLTLRWVVAKPLGHAVEELEYIAEADLSRSIEIPGRNEIGQLFKGMRHMQQSLGKIVTGVRDSSSAIRTGSNEISSGNADLSSRTEEQAASLQETASSMEELSATVKQNADNAQQANSLADEASTTASQSGEVMTEVTTTMRGISESSEKVAEIIGMIDSIAFQTNILALNASVEAARAGEQGRGFAVVASEVRDLAGRSADAAREIKQLIESSSQQVKEGSALVDKANETVEEVVNSVKRVTDIMDEISTASQEQSSSIDQVTQAVSQMDQVTQQNAALVEETSAAASSLEDQCKRLEQEVSVFRLADSQHTTINALPTGKGVTTTTPPPSPSQQRQGAASAHQTTSSDDNADDDGDWATF